MDPTLDGGLLRHRIPEKRRNTDEHVSKGWREERGQNTHITASTSVRAFNAVSVVLGTTLGGVVSIVTRQIVDLSLLGCLLQDYYLGFYMVNSQVWLKHVV